MLCSLFIILLRFKCWFKLFKYCFFIIYLFYIFVLLGLRPKTSPMQGLLFVHHKALQARSPRAPNRPIGLVFLSRMRAWVPAPTLSRMQPGCLHRTIMSLRQSTTWPSPHAGSSCNVPSQHPAHVPSLFPMQHQTL